MAKPFIFHTVFLDMEVYRKEILHKESRIKIMVDKKVLIKEAVDELITQRRMLEDYINSDPYFITALEPYTIDEKAPEIVTCMAEGAEVAGVGPMAAVAGTIAEFICKRLVRKGACIAIVENGGDIFAHTSEPVTVGLFSGNNRLGNRLAFELKKENTPLAICSSSSFLGHSLSFGKCDLATVFSKKGCIADAVATAACNKVIDEKDIKEVLEWAGNLEGVDGVLIVKDNKCGLIGDMPRLIRSNDTRIKEKITKDDAYTL
jgi:ApbE superfamily uncharacterized protein (UPF0280 family)